MKASSLLSLVLIALSAMGAVTAQVSLRDYSIVPPAPEVASLMAFKDYPVDNFRGIPTISLPIYSLRSGSIDLPITLYYHGGGIRTDEKVGNAGLGWNVICGAVISHTVYGAPDDANTRMHGLYHLNSSELQFRERLADRVLDYNPMNVDQSADISWQNSLGASYTFGQADLANDIYSLSGCNMSATFVRDRNGKTTISSDQPITITNTNNAPTITDGGCDGWGFDIKDGNGLTYEFLTQDRTRYDFHYGSPLLTQQEDSIYYASSWHLDKIKDLCGNEISFTYKKRSGRLIQDLSHPFSRGYSNPKIGQYSEAEVYSVSSVIYYPQILQQVEANGIKVKFTYVHEGTSHSEALIKTIEIISPDGPTRTYTFNYSGILLNSIKEGEQIIYSFDYNMEWDTELGYYYQDFGGFFNENGAYSLIPDAILGNKEVGRNADRSVSINHSHSLELLKIKYPTGGYTEFEWENNTFQYVNSSEYRGRINDVEILTRTVVDTLRFCLEEGYSKLKIINWHVQKNENVSLDLTRYFLMNPANIVTTTYDDEHDATTANYNTAYPPYYPHVLIREHYSQKIEGVYFLDKKTIEIDGMNLPINLTLSPGYYDFELVNPLSIQGEEDFLSRYFLYHDCEPGYIFIRKDVLDTDVGDGREYWCGMRIKRIKSYTGKSDDVPMINYYYYNVSRDPNYTTGTVQMLPKYDHMHYMWFPSPNIPGNETTEVYSMGGSAFPGTPIGSYTNIEYPQSMVCMGTEDRMEPNSYLGNKAETFYYSSARTPGNEDYNSTHFLPYQPVGARMFTSRAHRRGNLERHSYINASLPVRSEEYSYNIFESENLPLLTTNPFVVVDFTRVLLNNNGYYDYGIGKYTLIPYNKTIRWMRTVEENGIESVKSYEYFYDEYTENRDYNLVKAVRETDRSGLESVTYYTYPQSGGIKLPYPETQITLCGNSVINAERTEYNPQTWLPLRKFNMTSSGSLNNLISSNGLTSTQQKELINNLTFSYRYNSRGNLIEISYAGNVLASYLWGYNGLYPIIEAIGIDYETLELEALNAGLSANDINGMKISDNSRISSAAAALRLNLNTNSISGISYDWFNGILHFTDARGLRTSNSYDTHGRLSEVRDFNNYLITRHQYHYATED